MLFDFDGTVAETYGLRLLLKNWIIIRDKYDAIISDMIIYSRKQLLDENGENKSIEQIKVFYWNIYFNKFSFHFLFSVCSLLLPVGT